MDPCSGSTDNSNIIYQLQDDVVEMRVQCPKLLRRKIRKINETKIKILENTSFSTDHETFVIPDFKIQKHEQLINKNNQQKLKEELKSEMVVLRTLIRKRSCSVTELLK